MNAADGRVDLEGSSPAPLDVGRLRRELASMWKSASSRAGGTAVSRACASTLVFLDPCGEVEDADGWIQGISRRHPCRVLRVGTPDGEAPLTASAGAICHLRTGGGSLICIEEIRLGMDAAGEELLPSAIRALTIGGLPLVLLAPGRRARGSSAFRAMASDADRVIVCSRSAADLLEPADPPGRRDLAWSETRPLRLATARLTTGSRSLRVLHSLRRARIAAGGDSVPAAASLLVAGWLAGSLGLEVEAAEGGARLRGSHGIAALEFPATASGPDAAASLELHGDGVEIAIELQGGRVTARLPEGLREILVRSPDRADQVLAEIQRRREDPELETASRHARLIARALER